MINKDIEKLDAELAKTITVNDLMVELSKYDGRFTVCFVDNKNNMIPLTKKDIKMKSINIPLPGHTHIKDIGTVVIEQPG